MTETEQARERLQAAAAAEGLAQAASATASDAGYEEVQFEIPYSAVFDDGTPMDVEPIEPEAYFPFAKFPFGVPEQWSLTNAGQDFIYKALPDAIPVWAVPRVVFELRQRVKNLEECLAQANERTAVAASESGAVRPAIEKLVEALRWEANKLHAGAEAYTEQADELAKEWLQP